jgi:hypothetical protein
MSVETGMAFIPFKTSKYTNKDKDPGSVEVVSNPER